MNLKYCFYALMLSMIILTACSNIDPISSNSDVSQVALQIHFAGSNNKLLKPEKMLEILKIQVTVTGTDMNDIQQELVKNGNTAAGTFEIPKGKNRTFKVEGLDGNNRVQFDGTQTSDLNQDTENITITVAWITPPPVTVTISNITATSVDVSWTASTEPDFAFYRVLLDTSQPLSANDDGKKDITNPNSTSLKITGLNSSTQYYLAIVVVDTESRYNENTTAKEFTTAADQFTIPPGRP